MPLPTVTITETIFETDADNIGGTMRFTLSGLDIDSGIGVVVPLVTDVPVATDGTMTAALWPTDRGTAGRFYTVEFFPPAVSGVRTGIKFGEFELPESPSSATLSDLLLNSGSIVPLTPTLVQQAVAAAQAAALSAQSAAASAALADSEGNATIALNAAAAALLDREAAEAAATTAAANANALIAPNVAASASSAAVANTARADAEAARDLAETYAGVDHRTGSWTALAAISGTAGDVGYVGDDDAGTHTDPITAATVPNAGVYVWAANGLGSAQAQRVGSTGLAGKLSITDAPFVVGEADRAEIYLSVVDDDGFGNDILSSGGLFLDDFSFAQDGTGDFRVLDPDGFGYLLTPDVPPITQADVERTATEIASQRPFPPITTPLAKIIAHRGLWGLADIPENSIDSVTAAAAAGFDGVETDCVITSDGVFVINHDETLDAKFRTADTYAPVTGVSVIGNTFADLRAGYVLTSANPLYRRPIPTLEEYLDECLRCGIKPYVELKANAFATAENVQVMADLMIGKMGIHGCAFLSFSATRLDVVRARYPDAELLYIYNPTVSTANIDHVEAQNGILFPSQAVVTRDLVEDVHRRGLKMASWVVLPRHVNRLVKFGVDILVADFVPPRITNQKVLVSARGGHLWDGWADFTTTGTINADDTLTLSEGQTVTLRAGLAPSGGLNGVWARAQFAGALTGNVGSGSTYTLEAVETTTAGQYAWINLPAMYSGTPPQIRFTAGAGGAVIRLAEVAIIDIK